jgi:cobalt/nickel transport system ATP-binding protein
MNDLVFELKGVGYSYLGKFPALNGVDLQVRRGEKVALIGANGSGKSTLLQLLDGLIYADQGCVQAFGRELNERALQDEGFSRDFRKKVGFVFQNSDVQLFCPTVEEDLAFGPLQLGISRKDVLARVRSIAREFGIEELLQRQPHQLSAGERRKAAIASTLVIEPEVLLLDEPTAGLDPRTSRHIIDLIIGAHEAGRTVITATQDLHIVEEIADRIIVMSADKAVVRQGPAEEILSDRALLEAQNLVHAHSHRHHGRLHTHAHEHLEHHT